MFTGIVEEIGHINSVNNDSISVSCKKILEDINIGDSIAVDGVCLTVTSYNATSFNADVSYETMRVTKLGDLQINDSVNLERAMLATSRFGGHIVSGHIDCVGKIIDINKNGNFYELNVSIPDGNSQYFIKKGSITIDGISLTIYDLTENSIKVAVIPHTFENTNLKTLKSNSFVNIEFDILGKYVEKKLLMNDNKSNITERFLQENGFM